MPASIKLACTTTLALAAASGAAFAGQLDYTLYTGIEHSSNINLSTTDPISQNILIPGLDFTYTQQGSTLQANIAGDLEYRDFFGNRFNNQTQVQLAGQANWTVSPQRLDFTVQDFAGIQPIDSLASNAPNNQQQTNVFALGPTLHFQLGGTLRGQAELTYINSYAQKTDEFNSQRGQAALRIFKELNPTDLLSVNIESQRIAFSNSDGGPDYTRNEVYGEYVSKLTHFDLDAVLGWSQIDFDGAGAQTASSPLARVSLDWRFTERSTFTVAAAHQYSDAAQGMMVQPGIGQIVVPTTGGISAGDTTINSQVYLERTVELGYAYRADRFTVTVAPSYTKLSYLNGPTFNQSGHGGNFAIDYRLRPTLTLTAFANQQTTKYQTLDRRDNTVNYGLNLTEQWTPHWSWRASVSRQRRNSNSLDQSYRENEIYLGIVYKR
ncbi:outer membrane beta-barrel protein [Rhodanobacter sp. C01]|uniref:surface lipoprotein assembly modifier n=1 Tax=Rhodanobacter sp. C01 TaxID=1945856 RepID=UPI0009CD8D28|nr:outer membrane beta-barrel protein [Rhodanobacter sp. C01]OOG50994.1 hypothetical protein B0E50_02095 [Rhodanobacter sp. C01]